MARFEFVVGYADSGVPLPERKTTDSAGYDFAVAEDIVIPPYQSQVEAIQAYTDPKEAYSLEEMAKITKATGAKPTLVPTGVKCKLDPGTYLELSVRSSCPLKYWLVLANAIGIIDRDYYKASPTEEGEGHIYFQLINLSPLPIQLKKGDVLGQGIIKPYFTIENDQASGIRNGLGFGSTDG